MYNEILSANHGLPTVCNSKLGVAEGLENKQLLL